VRLVRPNSLAANITIVVLLASSIALCTLLAALLVFDNTSSHSLLRSRLSTLAEIVGQNSSAALNFTDKDAAGEILEALRAEPPVVSGCLYNVNNQLFAQYQRQVGSPPCPKSPAQLSIPGPKYTSVVHRVRGPYMELVGTLSLTSDMHDLDSRRNQLLEIGGCLIVLALAVGGVSGSFLQRRISRPIFDLARAMKEVTKDDSFGARVAVSGSDEIAQLGQGFNHMLAELERRESAKREAEAKLQYQACNDALTGLPNRRLFLGRLTQTLALARRESHTMALLYIDLDGFKVVNDSLGHSIGDLLLTEVALRLQARVRQSDTLARVGGDEFTVILASIHHKDDAALVAGKLLESLANPFQIEGHEITIGASIGISVFPDHATEGGDLMRQADSAMYAAKRNGKNQAMYFTPELASLVRERLNLENQLRGAVARGEIQVHYQPEFEVATGRLVRFEALARWFHPNLGLIPPNKFIPIAEESGLIIPLGAYVLEQACMQAVKWQSLCAHPTQVAVNVSSIQFSRNSYVEEVVDTLNRTGLKPELLQIELTETVMLGAVERCAQKMRQLRALGISLAIDDFGTGYSCLSYLPTLPFDALKIDRSFVREISSKPETVAMVHSLIGLAHNIGMRVIVEGIEELQQLNLIRKIGGNEIQGFLLGRPTPDPISQLALTVPNTYNSAEADSLVVQSASTS